MEEEKAEEEEEEEQWRQKQRVGDTKGTPLTRKKWNKIPLAWFAL